MTQAPEHESTPVKAQAALIDPATLEVVWASESESAVPLARLVPTAVAMGLEETLRDVAATGVARHLRADVVAMSRKSVALVVSIYRLPDGALLLLTEHALRVEHARGTEGPARRRGHTR
jgi:hypothetical protein